MTHRLDKDFDFQLARSFTAYRAEAARAAKLEAEVDLLGERVATEKENRKLRFGIAMPWLSASIFSASGNVSPSSFITN